MKCSHESRSQVFESGGPRDILKKCTVEMLAIYRQILKKNEVNQIEDMRNVKFDRGINDSTLLVLAAIMVLNFANDSQVCTLYVTYDI